MSKQTDVAATVVTPAPGEGLQAAAHTLMVIPREPGE